MTPSRPCQREMSPLFSKHSDDISLNEKLFEKVKTVYENRDKFNLTPEESKLLEDQYLGLHPQRYRPLS